jgi:hypothetical protein
VRVGWLGRLIDRIDARLDRPADQSVLLHRDRDGSERMLEADTPEQASAPGATVRRNRNRSRHRWMRR